ncbi:MAG TPA: metal-dependent hydrolase [Vicinamibacteria bacterium]|nr:metal-dependent hydrolase [Vicinamibacteria bacterium]
MDPIAHTLVGAALAQTGARRKSAYGSAALLVGANLPDVDALCLFAGADTALLFRRGWTHGIPAIVLLPLLLAGFLWVCGRRSKRDRPPVRFGALLGLSYLAVTTHPALDWLNTYGVRWLMPFDDRWFYGDTLFIIDPWIWLILGGAVFLRSSYGRITLIGWTGFGFLALLLMLLVVPGLAAEKSLWFASAGAIAVLRARCGAIGELQSRRLAVAAVAVVTVYIGAMTASARYARDAVERTLTTRGLDVGRLMVGPVPVTPFVKDVVVETPQGYRYGEARLFPGFELTLEPGWLPRSEAPVVRLAKQSPTVRGFVDWARFPFAEVEESASGATVYLLDARYTRSRSVGFGTARVELSREQLETAGK